MPPTTSWGARPMPESTAAATEAFQKLGEKSYAYPEPSPLLVFWVYDHPPIGERIKFAATYQPWAKGQAPKYVK